MSRMFPKMDFCISTPSRCRIDLDHRILAGPSALDGLKICFAADLHLRPSMDADAIADAISRCHADLILLGGDFSDTHSEALRLFRAFRGLSAPLGLFAACGNNDAEAFSSHDELRYALGCFGCRLLVNESASAGPLRIGGVDEYHYGSPDYGAVFPRESEYRILISHYPILPDARPEDMPDLMLCGHTHGGQFNFFRLTPFAIGFERTLSKRRLAPRRVSGTETVGRTLLLVSKGVGTSRIPLRVGVRSEIHLLEFRH